MNAFHSKPVNHFIKMIASPQNITSVIIISVNSCSLRLFLGFGLAFLTEKKKNEKKVRKCDKICFIPTRGTLNLINEIASCRQIHPQATVEAKFFVRVGSNQLPRLTDSGRTQKTTGDESGSRRLLKIPYFIAQSIRRKYSCVMGNKGTVQFR